MSLSVSLRSGLKLRNVRHQFLLGGPPGRIERDHLHRPQRRRAVRPERDQHADDDRHVHLDLDPVGPMAQSGRAGRQTCLLRRGEPTETCGRSRRPFGRLRPCPTQAARGHRGKCRRCSCVFRVFRGSILLGDRGIHEPREKRACTNGHAAGWSPSPRPSPWEGEGADKLVGEPAEYRGTAHPTSPGTGRGWGGSIRFAGRRLKSVTLTPALSLEWERGAWPATPTEDCPSGT